MLETVVVRLSDLDTSVSSASCVWGYVLRPQKPVDVDEIERALGRVVNKWRLLAGRLERDETTSVWTVRVPTAAILPPDYKTHVFTSTTSSCPLGIPIPDLTPGSATYIPARPSLDHFRRANAPASNAEFAQQQAPFLSLHVSVLSDCTAVGFSLPHGVLDGTGMGMCVHALDAELHGREWTAPPFQEENILQAEVVGFTKVVNGAEGAPEIIPSGARDTVAPGWWALKWMLASIYLYEYWWHKNTFSSVFLGEDVLRRIVEPAKQEAYKATGERVSTGDVLMAWVLKSAYINDSSNPNTANCTSGLSLRPLLPAMVPSSSPSAFTTYPHNCVTYFSPPPIPITSLPTTRLSTIALAHREALKTARDPAAVRATFSWTAKHGDGYLARRPGTDSWIFTNQAVANLPRIDLGERLDQFWTWNVPTPPDHCVALNKLNGGYVIMGPLRASQWSAIASEVERLNGNGERRVV